MSWRNLALAAIAANQDEPEACEHFGNNDNNAEPERAPPHADAEERAAIAVHDGGLPESWAGSLSMLEQATRPEGISASEWRRMLDMLWRRADECGAVLAAHGWTYAEVFGIGAHWARLDQRGAAWFSPNARIVSIDRERIVFENAGDAQTSICKQASTRRGGLN